VTKVFAQEYERAQVLFALKDYTNAAQTLRGVVEGAPENVAVRLLLARAYYHSAQLARAEAELRLVLQQDPVEAYGHLMLGRTLERQSRNGEAARHLRLAKAMGADQT
jgi:predicted Zn-dependent protease